MMIILKSTGGKTLHRNSNNLPYADNGIKEWYDFDIFNNYKCLPNVYEYSVAVNGNLIGAT